MKKYLYIRLFIVSFFLLMLSPFSVCGQKHKTDSTEQVRNDARHLLPSSSFDKELETLLKTWHKGYSTRKRRSGVSCIDSDMNPDTPDSVFCQRLSALPSAVSMEFNPAVKQCIKLYTEERRRLVRYMLSLADLYFPLIEETLDKHKLPLELKYLTIVESALNPTAISPAGAAGIWQFMLSTGKVYGLSINSLVDERLDLRKSTEAACRYFRDMYDLYHDWLLCIAAYNCGLGNVNKAIRRSGGKTNFWEIYPYLPRETRNYIPLFIGAYYAMYYHAEHKICAGDAGVPLATDTLMLTKQVSFDRILQFTDMSKDELRLLNPQYRREIIPGNTEPCQLRLPISSINDLAKVRDSLYSPELDVHITSLPSGRNQSPSSGSTVYHRVKRGEVLSKIARRYGTTVKRIMRDNGLKTTSIRVGQKLKVTTGAKRSKSRRSRRK